MTVPVSAGRPPGEQAQQRRLTRPVHADQTDHVARGGDQVQAGKQDRSPCATARPLATKVALKVFARAALGAPLGIAFPRRSYWQRLPSSLLRRSSVQDAAAPRRLARSSSVQATPRPSGALKCQPHGRQVPARSTPPDRDACSVGAGSQAEGLAAGWCPRYRPGHLQRIGQHIVALVGRRQIGHGQLSRTAERPVRGRKPRRRPGRRADG